MPNEIPYNGSTKPLGCCWLTVSASTCTCELLVLSAFSAKLLPSALPNASVAICSTCTRPPRITAAVVPAAIPAAAPEIRLLVKSKPFCGLYPMASLAALLAREPTALLAAAVATCIQLKWSCSPTATAKPCVTTLPIAARPTPATMPAVLEPCAASHVPDATAAEPTPAVTPAPRAPMATWSQLNPCSAPMRFPTAWLATEPAAPAAAATATVSRPVSPVAVPESTDAPRANVLPAPAAPAPAAPAAPAAAAPPSAAPSAPAAAPAV